MRKFILLLTCSFTLQASYAQDGKELMEGNGYVENKNRRNIILTKDGSRAAFTLTSIEPDEKNKADL
jgi:hypothetical protein